MYMSQAIEEIQNCLAICKNSRHFGNAYAIEKNFKFFQIFKMFQILRKSA
jgi:hypothetical protein